MTSIPRHRRAGPTGSTRGLGLVELLVVLALGLTWMGASIQVSRQVHGHATGALCALNRERIDRIAEGWEAQHGRRPARIEELIATGDLAHMPRCGMVGDGEGAYRLRGGGGGGAICLHHGDAPPGHATLSVDAYGWLATWGRLAGFLAGGLGLAAVLVAWRRRRLREVELPPPTLDQWLMDYEADRMLRGGAGIRRRRGPGEDRVGHSDPRRGVDSSGGAEGSDPGGPGPAAGAVELGDPEPGAKPRCPVCRDAVTDGGSSCPGCGTPHHEECFAYNQGCGRYGCTGLRRRAEPLPTGSGLRIRNSARE